LTPRYCGFESRPLREEPTPFLCAISASERDVSDANFGIALTMSLLAGVVLPPPELEHDDLIAESVANDLASYGRPIDERRSRVHGLAIGSDENLVESDGRTGLAFEAGKSDLLPGLDAKLLASRPNNRVCHSP
jgi:hypothetical protein